MSTNFIDFMLFFYCANKYPRKLGEKHYPGAGYFLVLRFYNSC